MRMRREPKPRRLKRHEVVVMFIGYVAIIYMLIRLVVYLLVMVNDLNLF